jgi:mannitol-1-phosphate 5-dehydrogenase
MKKAVHFGAGNIGRGFIGEILNKNDFSITFVDVNERIIDALIEKNAYEIELANDEHARIEVTNVTGINNGKNPDEVVQAIMEADIVTTAIGPNILPYIAQLAAKGIQARRQCLSENPLDFIACENMIGGSEFFFSKIKEYLTSEDLAYVEKYIGFPNAAVDRIVPNQSHEDPLYVVVEPFSEWVIDESQLKNTSFKLEGVHYATNLEPYIERKLFSVNSGHATVAYTGTYYGHHIISESLKDEKVMNALKGVQAETRALLLAKWDFVEEDLIAYHEKIISRFTNEHIVDENTRVARTPIRKLGYDERFIRPIRELNEFGLSYENHLNVVGKIFAYNDPQDEQSVALHEKLATNNLADVIKEVTGLSDEKLIKEIETVVQATR